jgi:hypothetical protein
MAVVFETNEPARAGTEAVQDATASRGLSARGGSAHAEECEDCQHDHHQPDEIDDVVHGLSFL